MPPKLGILAGGGVLPRRLIDAARQDGREVFVLAFNGQTDPATVGDVAHRWIRLGAAGEGINALKESGCCDLVMGGHIRRPGLVELRPDWRAARFFARFGGVALLGDDGLLRAIRSELENEGFRLLGPQDILSSLLTPSGYLTSARATEAQEADINRGIAVLRALAPLDVGQAAIVQQGLVLGVEAIEGTAGLIQRCGILRREGSAGVLVKLSKAQQDQKMDLPSIGPETMAQLSAAGFSGVAIEAGHSLLLDRAQTLAAAEQAGLFVLGVDLLS